MTASTLDESVSDFQQGMARPLARGPNFFQAWAASFLIYFYPLRTRQLWLKISPLRALFIGLLNLALAPLWLALFTGSVVAWDEMVLRGPGGYLQGKYVADPVAAFLSIYTTPPPQFRELLKLFFEMPHFAYISMSITVLLMTVTALGMLFFMLLPFAARPGRNRACVMHVIRAVMLSTGWVHIWGPLLSALYIYFIAHRYAPGLENVLAPLAAVFLILSLWTLASLIVAVRTDYRSPADRPQPHDPWCELCGYNLRGTAIEKRCPECGKSIAESIAPETRPPTPWESRPTIANVRVIRDQLVRIVREPRNLFFAMPTLTGQRAAQRWLMGSIVTVGICATLILPAYNLLCLPAGDRIDWSWNLLFSSLLAGFVWALLALMMVGIETAGIATFSRMKAKESPNFGGPGGQEGVFLSTSAKVTAYASILMIPWVFLGGAQLMGTELWIAHRLTAHWHISWRMEQIILAASVSIAHIGGLLWYEITVYRGIRGIQYANK
ncbi:MAG TPA: hypothetical protein VM008_14405 [Phycisphaerae bacterium]|nr:hypothetical protein [Phycisphaerae bacterium]